MTLPMIYVILVLVIPLTLVFMNRIREDTAALVMMTALMVAQFLGLAVLGPASTSESAEIALKGFGSPTILTLISLFIMTSSLEKYGLTSWISSKLISICGKSERRMIGLFSLTAAALSMIINNLAAGALLLPAALETSRRSGIKPSKLLIPIAYSTMLGGAAFYLSTANIIISGMLPTANPPQQPLGILDFTPTGGLVAIAGIVFLTLFGKYLLPDHEPRSVYKIPGSRGLTRTYLLQERLWEARIPSESELRNKTLSEANIGKHLGLAVFAVRRKGQILAVESGAFLLQENDTLIIVGREERVRKLEKMGFQINQPSSDFSFDSNNLVFAEVIIPPRSEAVGRTLRETAFREKCGFTAIALWRDNHSYRTDVAEFRLKAGDTLLLIGPLENIDNLRRQQEYILVEMAVNRSGMDKPKVLLTSAIVAGAIIAMVMGAPIVIAMLTAAVVLLLTKLVTMEEAYQAIKWRAIFLIAGVMSVSTAMVQTGLANLIGNSIIHLVAPLGGLGLSIGAILLSAGLSQVMGSQISPLVTGPIVISAAIELGVNPQAIAVVTGVATAILFLTPLAHPVNLIMIAPANYSFKDFFKVGFWLSIVCLITLIFSSRIFWQM